MTNPLDRFTTLVVRELSATSARVVGADEPEPEGVALSARFRDGRRVDAVFEEPLEDRAATARRLQMLVDAFESALIERSEPKRHQDPAVSLRDELRALVNRARATDAVVIDAHSPVTWATAHGTFGPFEVSPEVHKAIELLQISRRDLIDAIRHELGDDESPPPPRAAPPEPKQSVEPKASTPPPEPTQPMPERSSRALDAVRALPALASLRKGGHLAQIVREDDFGYLARSFAGIYVLIVVFDHLFDELRAERAVRDELPRIERLVLALPPIDPQPVGGVIALRSRRRR